MRKPASQVEVSFALLFPDVYEVGISHLGTQILYSVINDLDWAAAERAYAVWPDMQEKMREHGIPLYALESFRPVRTFDVVGFSLQYEMLYTNVLAMLELADVPLEAADRSGDDPIVIAGGPGAATPEPMAEFIDIFLPGEGEEIIVEFAELLRRLRDAGRARHEIILEAARRLEGVYAPAHYAVDYYPDGVLKSIRPVTDGVPDEVVASKVSDLRAAPYPGAPIVPLVEAVHDRMTLEIMRGCTRGCRFCQAGMLRRPVRSRSVDQLRKLLEDTYRATGQNEVALASLSSSDHPAFEKLLETVNAFAEPRHISLSLPSLRVSKQLTLVPEAASQVRRTGLTVAPEAASERLRQVINKDVTDAELLEGAREAYRQGWPRIKLYFMVGLPTETMEDALGIVELSERVSRARIEVAGGPGKVNVTVAPFVPKPHTPFQWEPMAPPERLREIRERLLVKARLRSVRYKFHDPRRSLLEAVMARGDRRLGAVLRRVRRAGGQFDAWDEHFSFERWQRAFDEEGLSIEFYATRELDTEEALPWDHIDFGLDREFLLKEREKAYRGEMTPDCREAGCLHCGACGLASRRQGRD